MPQAKIHKYNIIYVLIKEIHHQRHHEYEISANQQGMTCRISKIKHADHIVYANHKDCNFENKISIPKAEPEAPESDMVLCWCSRPAQCRAGMLQCRSPARCRAARNRNESRQRREQERKRVVVPPSTLPKNVIAVLTRAGEPSRRRRSGGLLFHLVCAQETEREELKVLLDCGDCQREF